MSCFRLLNGGESQGCIRAFIAWGASLTLILACLSVPSRAADGVFVLNTSTGAPYATEDRTGFQDRMVAEVFRRLGLVGRVERYKASRRALINANENIDHGVAMRVKGLEKRYQNLVRVDETFVENDFVAYSKGLDLQTHSWASLKPYAVAHIHGWVIFERNLLSGQNISTVKTPDQMLAMLVKNRVDLILYERWQGLQRARDNGLRVTVHEPPLASVDMYMYMHKRYASLVPRIADALRAMKVDGTYEKIYSQTLLKLRPEG